MRVLENLQYLNGLPVERDILDEDQEDEQQLESYASPGGN